MIMFLFAQFPQTPVLHGPVQAHILPGAFILVEHLQGTHTGFHNKQGLANYHALHSAE